jgi:hypothetical protein
MSDLDHPNPPEIFTLLERDLESGQREIQVVGELDLAVADQLQEAIERARMS